MSEQDTTVTTNGEEVTTQQDNIVEENSNQEDTTVEQENESTESNENQDTQSTEQTNGEDANLTPEEVTKNNLERLKQYELQEQDRQELLSKFGVNETQTNNYILEAKQIEQQIDNKLRHDWVTLCNEYGLPSDINTIQTSLEELKTKDPDRYIKFSKEKDVLLNNSMGAKQSLQDEILTMGVQNFVYENKPILEASPAIAQGVNTYIQSNLYNMQNPHEELTNVISSLAIVYKEAFEEGQRRALMEKAKKDTSSLNGGASVNSSQATYSSDHQFTRNEIKNMSLAEYSKNEKRIIEQMQQGLIK